MQKGNDVGRADVWKRHCVTGQSAGDHGRICMSVEQAKGDFNEMNRVGVASQW